MRYLTGWRIQLAKYLILQAGLSIAEVADRVGYELEAAFNRAFKRHVTVLTSDEQKWRAAYQFLSSISTTMKNKP